MSIDVMELLHIAFVFVTLVPCYFFSAGMGFSKTGLGSEVNDFTLSVSVFCLLSFTRSKHSSSLVT